MIYVNIHIYLTRICSCTTWDATVYEEYSNIYGQNTVDNIYDMIFSHLIIYMNDPWVCQFKIQRCLDWWKDQFSCQSKEKENKADVVNAN